MQIAQNQEWQKGDWEYNWNANGSLKSVKLHNGNLVEYEYDALGRRTKKIVNNKIIRYLWDNNVLLHEWEYDKTEAPRNVINKLGEVSFDKPEPVQNLITWIYEQGSFVPCAKIVGNETFSIINDYIGRPIQAYNNNGNLVWSTEYDIYGNLRNLKGEKDFIPFRQLGQYEDCETGLYYNRFRYYDPNTGIYISKDPISILGGLNVYAYVHDVNSYVDIFGLLGKIVNKVSGDKREAIFREWLKEKYPNADILSERYITNSSGIGVKDEITNSRRRLDFIVIENSKVIAIYEVTSPTADKTLQQQKELRIRKGQGKFIKEKGRKGKIYDITDIENKRVNIDLETGTIKCN